MLHHTTALAVLLVGCGSIRRGDHDRDDNDDRQEEITCGYNAAPAGRSSCECETHYEWCDNSQTDCCAFGTDTFKFTVRRAGFLPYKGPDSEEPWDWDGDVPNWLIDAMNILGVFVPEAASMAEVLGLVDEYAPELLEGTVPPDPYIEYWINDEVVDASPTEDNTYEPNWRDTTKVRLGRNDTLYVVFVDEDLTFDDEADSIYAGQEDLQWLAGRGPLTMEGPYYLFDIVFEVEPVW